MGTDTWKIDSLTVGPFATNHYLLQNLIDRTCWLFDCGFEGQALGDWIERSGCRLQEILVTHGHIDHISAVDQLCNRFAVGYAMHKDDVPLTANLAMQGQMFGMSVPNPSPPVRYLEPGLAKLGSLSVQILATPGHSPGSVSFYFPELESVICGDVLFQGSIGRTDLPGGDLAILSASIREQLYSLPDNTVVLPGHMSPTTIGEEKRSNPFVGAI